MYETVRLYGRHLMDWVVDDVNGRPRLEQVEIEYREYDTGTGEIVAAGSEDFSRQRLNTLNGAYVWTWDGVRRMSGGQRWFDCRGFYEFPESQRGAFRRYLRTKYPDAVAISIRGI